MDPVDKGASWWSCPLCCTSPAKWGSTEQPCTLTVGEVGGMARWGRQRLLGVKCMDLSLAQGWRREACGCGGWTYVGDFGTAGPVLAKVL